MAEAEELPKACPCCGRRSIRHTPAGRHWYERRLYACGHTVTRVSHIGHLTDEHGWLHETPCGTALPPMLAQFAAAH